MDAGVQLNIENPYKKSNWFSKLFFIWMVQLYKKGVKYGLSVADLYKTLQEDKSDKLGEKLELNWKNELQKAELTKYKPSLIMAITKTFFWQYMINGTFLFIQFVIMRTSVPIILAYLIYLFSAEMEGTENVSTKRYMYGAILVATFTVITFTHCHLEFGQLKIGMRVRVAVSTLIYRKMLRLNKKSLGQASAGTVINLLSNDVSRFDMICCSFHFLWIAPFQLIIVTYFLWELIGISALAGIMTLIMFTIPSQVYLAKLTSIIRSKIAVRTDRRLKLMNEIISGVQVIKMFAWEKPFEKLVGALRAHEIEVLTLAGYIKGFFQSGTVFTERTVMYFTLICYTLLGNVITAAKVFSVAQFFNLLQIVMAIYLPQALSVGAETLVAISRLRSFLLLDEIDESTNIISQGDNILISNVQASWPSETDHITLNNITLEIANGKLCAVIGPVGAGKSSLLQLLLGELIPQSGKLSVCGDISYSSQEPWLFVSSIRNNILFGKDYIKEKYNKIVEVCALLPDFKQFPNGDKTIIGERGISLSGGQRARINLARAIYRDADIYMLDDPLSAVDTYVGQHLFEKCIMESLHGKTRILVTHQLQYLKKADIIIVLNAGIIEAIGTFDDLAKSNIDFSKMIVAADETVVKETKSENITKTRSMSITSLNSLRSTAGDVTSKQEENNEEVELIGMCAYKEYAKSAGNFCVLFTFGVIFLMGQVTISGADLWTSYWTHQEELRHLKEQISKNNHGGLKEKIIHLLESSIDNEETAHINVFGNTDNSYIYNISEEASRHIQFAEPMTTHHAIYIYTCIIIGVIFFNILRSFTFFKLAMVASTNLHSRMFHHLMKAPMRFFDTNPSGRILNRFSKDMGTADELLPRIMLETMQFLLLTIGILVIVAITHYYLIVAIVFFGIIFSFLRKWYLTTAKLIKHLEGMCKSPVFSHLNSSANGIITIRACKAEDELIKQFDHHQDVHTSAYILTIGCMSSFGLWLDIIGVLFTATVVFNFILVEQYGEINASLVGLAISQCLILTEILQYGARLSTEVVNQMTSVERVLQYTRLEEEGPFETENNIISKAWPETGNIKFKKMYLKYSEFDAPVLKNLDFQINSGEKIGIVGRTGAGKSSLISALFRLTSLDGSIEVDGIDTKTLGLTNLRKTISIIPQEPVLFSASLRYNLDPFEEFDDMALWNALEEVELKEVVPSLNFLVEQGGSNFSLGQRQLVCLARAILKNNKILVLDEATANVDPKTDRLIQNTIRKKFGDCTILTIAHRLNTIMDSDRVIVMDNGAMVEYHHPYILLQNASGIFTGMVEQTGPTMTKTLKEVAYEAYMKSNADQDRDITALEIKKNE